MMKYKIEEVHEWWLMLVDENDNEVEHWVFPTEDIAYNVMREWEAIDEEISHKKNR